MDIKDDKVRREAMENMIKRELHINTKMKSVKKSRWQK